MTIGSAGTKGFLFCDLRGYSAFVEHAGDAAAAELLETYRGLVRGVIAVHEGAEIRTEGDSVYVVFPTASSAVEAGLGIVAAAAEWSTKARPVRVGVGIHAGETVATTEGPVGGAVNIAARVCAKAQAGEVLVTDTVRALTRTFLPYRFVGLGSQPLKGIPGGIPLYRVEAVAGSRRSHLRRRLVARRRQVALVAGLVALVLVGVTGAWALNRPPDCLTLPASTADVVARIDPARGCVVQLIAVGRHPDSIVATDTAVWVANETDWTVTRIDLASRRPSHTVGMPGAPISLATQADGQVEVLAYDDLTGIAVQDPQVQHRVVVIAGPDDRVGMPHALPVESSRLFFGTQAEAPSAYTAIATSNGWAWVVSPRGTVVRVRGIDRFDRRIATGDLSGYEYSSPALVAATGGTVWVADLEAPAIYRFDGLVDRPQIMTLSGDRGTRAMAASPTDLWLLRQDGSLTRIDATTKEQRNLSVDGTASALAVGPESLWLLDDSTRMVRAVDPATGRTISSIAVGGVPGNAVEGGGALWVTIHEP